MNTPEAENDKKYVVKQDLMPRGPLLDKRWQRGRRIVAHLELTRLWTNLIRTSTKHTIPREKIRGWLPYAVRAFFYLQDFEIAFYGFGKMREIDRSAWGTSIIIIRGAADRNPNAAGP